VGDATAFRKEYAAAAEKIQTIKAEFKQEKNMAMLEEKIHSSGHFFFKKTNKVRMEYVQPFKYLMVINGDKILIRDQQKTSTYSGGDNKLFRTINKIILDCVQGKILDNKDFSSQVFESEKQYSLDLKPHNKDLKKLFATIRLHIKKSDFSIDKMEMIEPMGDNTVLSFFNKELNGTVKDEVFAVK
jgi:outer membrane lipoprotein-sorting protein